MKSDDLLMMMAAAVGIFLIANMSKAKAATPAAGVKTGGIVSSPSSNAGFGNVIMTWNGWTYFDSGYGKDQFGNIYYQGEKVVDGIWGAV